MTYLKKCTTNGAHGEGTSAIIHYSPGTRFTIIFHVVNYLQVVFETIMVSITDQYYSQQYFFINLSLMFYLLLRL